MTSFVSLLDTLFEVYGSVVNKLMTVGTLILFMISERKYSQLIFLIHINVIKGLLYLSHTMLMNLICPGVLS